MKKTILERVDDGGTALRRHLLESAGLSPVQPDRMEVLALLEGLDQARRMDWTAEVRFVLSDDGPALVQASVDGKQISVAWIDGRASLSGSHPGLQEVSRAVTLLVDGFRDLMSDCWGSSVVLFRCESPRMSGWATFSSRGPCFPSSPSRA